MKSREQITISKRGKIGWPVLVLLVAACFLPLLTTNGYFMHVIVTIVIAASLATNFNFSAGYAGQVTFSHAAFYGMGAYTTAILSTKLGMDMWINIPISFVLVAVIAFLLGIPTLRLKGSYRVICTIGFQIIFETLALRWMDLTNGPLGIANIPAAQLFGIKLNTPYTFFYIAMAWLLFNILLLWRVESSRLGFELLSIKGDEQAALANGVNTPMRKLIAFSVSAGLGGVSGVIYAHYMGSIDPNVFTLAYSAVILCMSLLGGSATIFGGLVGAAILITVPEVLRAIQEYRMLIYGAIMVLLVLFMPNGIIGAVNKMTSDWKVRKGGKKHASTDS